MVCDLARLFSDNMAILNYQFGGIFAAFFAFRSNSSHTIVVSRRLAQVSNEFEFVQNLKYSLLCVLLKFMFSKKTTKIDEIFTVGLTLTT